MFIACPHCRYLVATDPRGQHAPQRCPRCGGPLDAQAPGDATAAGQSLATLLRRDEALRENGNQDTTAHQPGADAQAHADDGAGLASETVEAAPPAIAEDATAARQAQPAADAAVEAPEPAALPGSPDGGDDPATAASAIAATEAAHDSAQARRAVRAPAFLRGTRAPAGPIAIPRWQWAALCVLALALALQVLLADRQRLSADAGWRPLILSLCGALGCSVPPWHEPAAFAMLDRDVRPVSGAPGVLLAQATFRNDARWSQQWPILMLTLKDADGRTLGARALRPDEYLPGDANAGGIAPGQSAQVAVRVREPSASVVAYAFDFL